VLLIFFSQFLWISESVKPRPQKLSEDIIEDLPTQTVVSRPTSRPVVVYETIKPKIQIPSKSQEIRPTQTIVSRPVVIHETTKIYRQTEAPTVATTSRPLPRYTTSPTTQKPVLINDK
jgi:hypothetical protein